MNRIIKQFSGIMLFIILLSFSACHSKPSEGDADAGSISLTEEISLSDKQLELAGVVLGKLEKKMLSDNIRCNGTVEVAPEGLVSISLPMDGYVRKITIHEGSEVQKGDLLAVMQHPDFLNLQQEYLVTGNDLIMVREDLSRQEALVKEDATSGKKLTAARTHYENVLIRHNSLGEKLKMMGFDPLKLNANNLNPELKIYSPVNGFVRANYANTGVLIPAGTPIMEIEDNSRLHIHLWVYEQDINQVSKGLPVEFKTGSDEKQYTGEVFSVGRTIDDKNQTATVLVRISNPDDVLISGMYIKAGILIRQSSVWAIPEPGIAMDGGLRYVLLREGDLFRRVQVETGISRNGFIEIKSPESLIDKELAVAGAYYLNARFSSEE